MPYISYITYMYLSLEYLSTLTYFKLILFIGFYLINSIPMSCDIINLNKLNNRSDLLSDIHFTGLKYTSKRHAHSQTERVTANIGENVIIKCAFENPNRSSSSYVVHWEKKGNKIPIYIWYHGYPPHVSEEYKGRISLVNQASLNLSNVQESDQGMYQCQIFTIGMPNLKSQNGTWIDLVVQAPPHFEIKPPDVVYVKVGEYLSLSCDAKGTPTPIISWYKDNAPIVSTESVQVLPKKLRITSLDKSDVGDYLCVARNKEGSVSASTQVLIAGSAVITMPPRNLTKLEGDKIEFVCEAKALPSNVTYHWYKNGKDVTTNSDYQTRFNIKKDGTLLINPVSAEDSGKYTCEVYNGIGTSDSASAWLNVEYPARVKFSPSIQYLPLGLSGIIRCFVEASPSFQFITWTKDRRPFDPSVAPGVITLENGTLLFERVNNEHQGRYRCTPYNIHGTAGNSNVMEILVREPPMFTVKPDEVYQQSVNGEVKMSCDGIGQPKPTIVWRRADGGKLPKDRSFVRNGNFTLKAIKKDDHGRYECVLENEIATLVTSTLLLVNSTTPHAPINVSVNTSAFAATVTWQPSYDGGHEQTYIIWYRRVDQGDSDWKTIRVRPESSTVFTLYNLQPDTEYEFQVYARNILGEGLPSEIARVRTKVWDINHGSVLPTDGYGSTYIPSGPNQPEKSQTVTPAPNTVASSPQESSDSSSSSGPKPGPPRNVTVTRVAQGYAISWLSPLNKTVPVAYYLIEYKTGTGQYSSPWKFWGPISKETSYLAKSFKPGEVYTIRVYAHSILGAGQPSQEIKYDVPGGSYRHSKDKAIAAGVVGGILFFIAAIVLSVCTVKICNERKRRKAEKAYLMVTCPIMNARNGTQSQAGSPMSLKSHEKGRISSIETSWLNALIQADLQQRPFPRFSTLSSMDTNGVAPIVNIPYNSPKITV